MDAKTTESGIRIQKVMANAGIASRRGAEALIQLGVVKLNGQKATLGQRMDPTVDKLEVKGELVHPASQQASVVYALYKPKRCVTTLDDPEGRPTVKDFFPQTKKSLFPVGRLDYDAEGLLLITNDGDFAQKVIHPKFKIWKTYFVKIKGLVQKSELEKIKSGPVFAGKKHQPVRVKILHTVNDKTWLEVSLQEGKNQHIKKMFKAVGYLVLKIKRFSIGSVTLGDLEPGRFRKLSPAEITELLKISEKS